MTREELEELREGWDFEAKLAAGRDGQGAVPLSLWETYSAMANTEGGVIVLGAREREDQTLDYVGIADLDKVESDLWNTLQNPIKVSANVLRRQDVERVEIDGRGVLVIRVPKASRAQRPVYLNGSWERGTYLRVHAGDRTADREVARRMLADSVPNRDAEAVAGMSRADLHPESVRRYREFFAATRKGHPFLEQDDVGFLLSIGALVRGHAGEDPRPSLAGLLMLGGEIAIREILPHWHLSYREPPDAPSDPRRWVDRLHPDGSWNANLFQFYLRAIVKLHEGLKVPFALQAGQIRIDETPVHAAIREALVNTLIHADYQGPTGVRVVRSRAVFEFINPGLLLIPTEQVWRGGVSESRNPAVQRLFGFLQLGEREGSGGPTMLRVWKEQHWRAPRLREEPELGETHLEMRQESLLPEAAVTSLVRRFGDAFRSLDELGRVIVVTAEAEGGLSHAHIRELSDAHPHDITVRLRDLVRRGFLESVGRTRGVTYSVSREPGAAGWEAGGVISGESSEATSGGAKAAASGARAATSGVKHAISLDTVAARAGARAATSGAKAATSRGARAATSGLALPARASPEAMRQAIVSACAEGFLTVTEIARKTGRAATTIRMNFLPALVREGRLRLRFPDVPNHPGQAYQTVAERPS